MKLLKNKPWLSALPLKTSPLSYLEKQYPINSYYDKLNTDEQKVFQDELAYINSEVAPKRNGLREKKSDEELLLDVRYYGKYSDYLL